MSYKGTSRKVKDCLVNILTNLTYDAGSGAEPLFVKVLDNTHDEFEGYPIARVLPDRAASSVQDSISWLHEDSFAIIVTWPLTDPSNVESDLYNAAYDCADLVRDTLEHDDHAATLNSIDPTLSWNFATVPSTSWRVATSKQGGAILALSLNVTISYSQTAI
ncbi:MAG TPA: hypothetical protein VFH39_04175 [Candidatus Saccharimonadales bacterium]|nr:hypothetical protein [Candidatus Saccharimonadales bacterium]